MTEVSVPTSLTSSPLFIKDAELLYQNPPPVSPIPSESDSSSDDERSSQSIPTPASELLGCTPSSFSLASYPAFCVYVPASIALKPSFLRQVFDERVGANHDTLAICLACDFTMADCEEDAFRFSNAALNTVGMSCGRWSKEGQDHSEVHSTHYIAALTREDGELDATTVPKSFMTPPVAHQSAFSLASLRPVFYLPSKDRMYMLYILERPPVTFPPLSATPSFNPFPDKALGVTSPNIPTLAEWQSVWAAWDLVTLGMIPQEMLHQKPIDLRHKCLFYIGHIPTFLDMLLHKAIGGGPTEPKHFWSVFERGIDPHVDDPDHCHNHSEVPEKDEDWPTLPEILSFRAGVRARLTKLYGDLETGKRRLTRNIARTLVMTIEHEGWHIETLLYMLLQRAGSGVLPPPGFTMPPFELLSSQWDAVPLPSSSSVTLGPAAVILGHDDSEDDDIALSDQVEDVVNHMYGWDNESPLRTVQVGKFRSDWRPVSNKEFEAFWRASDQREIEMPKSWAVDEDGQIKVRTIYGPVPMSVAQHWPVLTSYDNLAAFAKSKGGRLPTEPELRLFLDTYDVGHEGGANIGFRNWHPIPATAGLAETGGRGSNGGVWEWTSTAFDTHEGLVPTKLFPGYSTDFFDTKHQVVLGSSYATIPRLASRRTVRNFYQHNYPYPWVGARVVYDI